MSGEFYSESKGYGGQDSVGISSATSFLFKGLCGLSVSANSSSFGFDNSESTAR